MRALHASLLALLASGCGDAVATADSGDTSGSAATGEPTPTTGEITGSDGSGDSGRDTGEPACAADGEPGGVVKWTRTGDELPGWIRAIASNAAGHTILVGIPTQEDAYGDAFVQVYDAAGAPLWSDVYAGSRGLWDTALDVAVDGAGFIHVLVQEQVLAVSGESWASIDARLVVLRYAPDGAHVWRWEREREPIEPGGYYDPGGRLGIDGDTIRLLEQVFHEPPVALALDAAGNLLTEATLAEPNSLTIDQSAFGPDGAVYLAGNLDDSQGNHPMWVGRFAAADGSLVWSDTFGSPKQDNITTLTPGRDGEVYLAHTATTASMPPGADYYLRRHDSDGALAWSTLLPVDGAGTPSIPGGGLHCDGSPLLAGGIAKPAGPELEWDNRLDIWVARYQTDGTPHWTFEHEIGPPYSHGGAGRIVGTPQGDVLVFGIDLAVDPSGDGSTEVQWLRRLTGG